MHHGAAQSQRQRQRPPVLFLRYCPRPPRRHLVARNTKGTGARPQPRTTPPPRSAPAPCPARPALLLSFAPSPPSSAARQNSDLAGEFWMNFTSTMQRTWWTQILRLARPRAGSRTPIVRTCVVHAADAPSTMERGLGMHSAMLAGVMRHHFRMWTITSRTGSLRTALCAGQGAK